MTAKLEQRNFRQFFDGDNNKNHINNNNSDDDDSNNNSFSSIKSACNIKNKDHNITDTNNNANNNDSSNNIIGNDKTKDPINGTNVTIRRKKSNNDNNKATSFLFSGLGIHQGFFFSKQKKKCFTDFLFLFYPPTLRYLLL